MTLLLDIPEETPSSPLPESTIAETPALVDQVNAILANPQGEEEPTTVAATSTDVIMGCGLFTTGLPLHPTFFFKGMFDPNASDSESEAEMPFSTSQKPGNKKPSLVTELVFNKTKREGRQKFKGKYRTKRKDKKRVVPRVNNRINSEADWPDLEADAHAIHDMVPEYLGEGDARKKNQSFGATTIVCAVLKTDTEYRKVAFCNMNGAMPPALRDKAHNLGYHVVQALQSHAEGEMVQYCNTYKYREVVDMGCDKEHCAECHHLMTTYFGGYRTQSGRSDKVFQNYYMPDVLQEATGLNARPSELPEWGNPQAGGPPLKRRKKAPQ